MPKQLKYNQFLIVLMIKMMMMKAKVNNKSELNKNFNNMVKSMFYNI